MIASTCSKHGETPDSVCATCRTCNRIRVEADIVTRTVDALLAAGYALNVENGGEGRELVRYTTERATVLRVLMDTDEDFLLAVPAGETPKGWGGTAYVQFVYGNEGWEVICDYTTSLESALAPVLAYTEQLMQEAER